MTLKKLKDPIYGYISIPGEIMAEVVDTATFQRLRHIAQTSYAPLYPSAVHNRFVHSLGVYHLGTIAANTITEECEKLWGEGDWGEFKKEIGHYKDIFLLACLLHDVGHAPFSHTGETFYLENHQGYAEIHELLKKTVGSELFNGDVPSTNSNSAAAHEIMSAIVGIREFPALLSSVEDKDFFARCITGYGYPVKTGKEGILNCFIQLLNSKVIDVDKLDYLLRDAYSTGFYTVQIDYQRLLTSLTIIKENEEFSLAYYRGAISVIENVVYAHDAERKWIQSHPIILYESYLLQHIMELLTEKLDSQAHKLFSLESLSGKGQTFDDGTQVRLLCDDDIIYLSKRYYEENEFVSEFFERGTRRHPLWKSEAEYKSFFLDIVGEGKLLDQFEQSLEATAQYLSKNTTNWIINRSLADKIKGELDSLKEAHLDPATKKAQKVEKQNILKVINSLIDHKELGENIVILKASQFNSGFAKPDFASIKIVFPSSSGNKVAPFGKTVSSVAGVASDRPKFFYLYYRRKNTDTEQPSLDIDKLGRELFRAFI